MAISQTDNGAPALVSTSMVPEAPIGGAPVTAPVEVIPSGSELSDYERLRRPLPRLLLLLAPLLLFLPGAYFHPPVERMLAAATIQNPAGMGLFLTDLFIFACFWLVYFSSGWGGLFACQSLRTLLQRHSTQWLSPEDPKIKGHDLADLAAARREKAKTTMTSQAIFIAISVFIISSVSQNAALLPDGKVLPLDAALVILALSAAISSFTLLLISTDAAETMFNTFAKTREDLAIHRLYTVSARLKYYGFVLSFLALSLFVATLNAFVGALALALLLFVGYRYWFADASDGAKFRQEARLFQFVLIAVNAYIILAYIL